MYKRILVPLDGSELAEQVLPHVVELARCTGAEIILVRAPLMPIFDYLVTDPQLAMELSQESEHESLAYLNRIRVQLTEQRLLVKTSSVVVDGPVHTAILDLAKEMNVDLIAMSTHGRSGFARLVMGSVADQIVHHAHVPVLLVRPQSAQVEFRMHSRPESVAASKN